MTTSVLFMCPHSAGKSLAAATYFRAAAARKGLAVAIAVAGPDPDEVNMPTVAGALETQGFTIGWHPQLVSIDDTDRADIVVSIGCDPGTIPGAETAGEGVSFREWDVPLISKDLFGSLQAIHTHAEALATELSDR